MRKYQVISRDAYGTTVILQTCSDLASAIKRIRFEVTNLNFDNALTTDDKYRTIEAFFPVLTDEAGGEIPNAVYAGNNLDGRHRAYVVPDEGPVEIRVLDNDDSLLLFIGVEGQEDRYLQDTKRQPVRTLKHELLEGKAHYCVKVIE